MTKERGEYTLCNAASLSDADTLIMSAGPNHAETGGAGGQIIIIGSRICDNYLSLEFFMFVIETNHLSLSPSTALASIDGSLIVIRILVSSPVTLQESQLIGKTENRFIATGIQNGNKNHSVSLFIVNGQISFDQAN